MAKPPELSVVIATKDRPGLLPIALDSVLEQGDSLQVVVVDDGSGHDNAEVVRAVCARDRRVLLLRNERSLGAPAARNVGLARCEGRYWAALDDDDRWLPGKWSAQRDILERSGHPDDLVLVAAVRIAGVPVDARRDVPLIRDPERLSSLRQLFESVSVRAFCHALVVPTDLMREVGGFDERLLWGEYTDLLIRLGKVARFAGTDQVGVEIQKHHEQAGSRRGRHWSSKVDGIRLLLEKHRAEFRAEPALLAQYLHVLGVSQLRAEERWGAAGTFLRVAARGSGARRRVRALGHLVLTVAGGPGLWRSVARLRHAGDV